jgi:predicted lipoprotein with Yx(FWY)xxD motif
MRKTIVTVSIVLALAIAGAALASAQRGTAVVLRKTSLAKVLTTSKNFVLYVYTPDGKNKSHCYNACAATWTPLLTTGKPSVGAGLKKALLSTTKRKDGKIQVTYHGHPLYTYIGDTAALQTNGEGVNGIWYVLNAAGNRIGGGGGGGGGGGCGAYCP